MKIYLTTIFGGENGMERDEIKILVKIFCLFRAFKLDRIVSLYNTLYGVEAYM